MLVHTGEETVHDPHWQLAAASLTTGMILHVSYAAALPRVERMMATTQFRRSCSIAGLGLPFFTNFY
jgi:hypothetical protein